jgi:hypothetical protein
MSDLLNNNLDNIGEDIDLFGLPHQRLSMSDRIGFLPISIWKPNWETVKTLKDLVGDAGETRNLVGKKMQLLGSKYTTSIFNPHLAQMILSAYCPQKAKIYDAFGGGGTRGFIASAMGHDYTGVEIREDEVARIKMKQLELNTDFEITVGDSRFYPIEENYFDFSYSCPPYYNLEVYSTLDGDMSNVSTYQEFLGMLKQSLEVTYRGLKHESLCIWVVGNLRDKKGNLIHLSGDTIRLGLETGFVLHDELIFWGASDIAVQRVGQFNAHRRSVRVHEQIIILKKP